MSSNLTVTAPGDLDIVMTRTFDAPRDLVYEAMTSPEFLKRWMLGPDGWTMPVCQFDARTGGAFRHEWRHSDGSTMGMGGTFLEVVPQERIVRTEVFDEAWFPGEAVVTSIFEESGGRTTVTTTIHYDTKEARDGVLKSPMEGGVAMSYDRLAALLQEASSA